MLKEGKIIFLFETYFYIAALLNQCDNMFCHFVSLSETRKLIMCVAVFLSICAIM